MNDPFLQPFPFFQNPSLPSDEESSVKILWRDLRLAAQERRIQKSVLAASLSQSIVLNSLSLAQSLALILSRQQAGMLVSNEQLEELFSFIYEKAPSLVLSAALDLRAIVARDPAAKDALIPFLYFKGFHAVQTHRLAHWLWMNERKDDALFLQSRSSLLYAVDIHPAAPLGQGIMLDHATGLVVGETATIGDHVSLLHGVTLGGTGKETGDRHPKVRAGVMIGAGATILGNVEIGEGACIAAGSVVLQNVSPHTTVAGIPAKIVGTPKSSLPAEDMDQNVIPPS